MWEEVEFTKGAAEWFKGRPDKRARDADLIASMKVQAESVRGKSGSCEHCGERISGPNVQISATSAAILVISDTLVLSCALQDHIWEEDEIVE
jgi:hypothetical protein